MDSKPRTIATIGRTGKLLHVAAAQAVLAGGQTKDPDAQVVVIGKPARPKKHYPQREAKVIHPPVAKPKEGAHAAARRRRQIERRNAKQALAKEASFV